jgi:hypothetical protein
MSEKCQDVLLSTMPQVASRGPWEVDRHTERPSSKSLPRARQVQSAAAGNGKTVATAARVAAGRMQKPVEPMSHFITPPEFLRLGNAVGKRRGSGL